MSFCCNFLREIRTPSGRNAKPTSAAGKQQQRYPARPGSFYCWSCAAAFLNYLPIVCSRHCDAMRRHSRHRFSQPNKTCNTDVAKKQKKHLKHAKIQQAHTFRPHNMSARCLQRNAPTDCDHLSGCTRKTTLEALGVIPHLILCPATTLTVVHVATTIPMRSQTHTRQHATRTRDETGSPPFWTTKARARNRRAAKGVKANRHEQERRVTGNYRSARDLIALRFPSTRRFAEQLPGPALLCFVAREL